MIQTINETINRSILDSVEFPIWDCARKSIDYPVLLPVLEAVRDSILYSMSQVSMWNSIWGSVRELTEEANNG